MKKVILITGGAGFIGSHVVRRFIKNYKDYTVVNLDKLTYAGNLENLIDIERNPEKIIENLIKVAFRDKNKKSDIIFC